MIIIIPVVVSDPPVQISSDRFESPCLQNNSKRNNKDNSPKNNQEAWLTETPEKQRHSGTRRCYMRWSSVSVGRGLYIHREWCCVKCRLNTMPSAFERVKTLDTVMSGFLPTPMRKLMTARTHKKEEATRYHRPRHAKKKPKTWFHDDELRSQTRPQTAGMRECAQGSAEFSPSYVQQTNAKKEQSVKYVRASRALVSSRFTAFQPHMYISHPFSSMLWHCFRGIYGDNVLPSGGGSSPALITPPDEFPECHVPRPVALAPYASRIQ